MDLEVLQNQLVLSNSYASRCCGDSDYGAVKLPLGTWNSNDTTAHSNPDHIPLHCIATLQLMSESHRLPSSHRHKCSTSEALELSRKC